MSTPRIDAAYNELIAKHGYTDAFDVLAVGRQLETELQAKDRTIERLRLALRQIVTGADDDHDGFTYEEIAHVAAAALQDAQEPT